MEKTTLWNANFLLACSANFLMAFAFYLIATTMPFYITKSFQTTESMTGVIMASYISATLMIRPFSGFMVDRFSRKAVYLLSFAFFVLLFLGYMWAGVLTLFVLVRTLHGLTWGIVTTASSTIAIDIIPSQRRGEGVGYFGLTMTLAMSIGPFIGLYVYEHFPLEYNFYAAFAFGLLGLFLASCIKTPHKPIVINEPLSLDRFLLVKAIPIGFNLLLIALCYGMVFVFAPKYGIQELKLNNTGLLFLFMAVGMAISRLFAGKLLDKGHTHRLVICSMLLLSISYLVFGLATSGVGYFGAALFIGGSYGVLSPTFQTLFISMAPHSKRGTANSTYFTFYDLGIGVGMIVSGFLADYFHSFSKLFLVASVLCLLALAMYWGYSKNIFEKNKI